MKFSFLLLAILFFSCEKEKCGCDDKEFIDATVINSGPVAADGCDWVIKIGTVFYHPDSLPADFKQSDLNVKICYKNSTDIFRCGFSASGMPVIHVIAIKK